jgi:hypothetical protein
MKNFFLLFAFHIFLSLIELLVVMNDWMGFVSIQDVILIEWTFVWGKLSPWGVVEVGDVLCGVLRERSLTERWLKFDFGLLKRWLKFDFGLLKRWLKFDFGLSKRWLKFDFGLPKRWLKFDFGLPKRWLKFAQALAEV